VSGSVITLALSKGRILDEALPLLARIGITLAEDPEQSRKLIIPTSRADLRVVLVRASDVPTYVQRGGADLGVVGLDTLLEHGGEGLYRPLARASASPPSSRASPASTSPTRACTST
jgi:ATP phosphoribosyltransferase